MQGTPVGWKPHIGPPGDMGHDLGTIYQSGILCDQPFVIRFLKSQILSHALTEVLPFIGMVSN